MWAVLMLDYTRSLASTYIKVETTRRCLAGRGERFCSVNDLLCPVATGNPGVSLARPVALDTMHSGGLPSSVVRGA
jgi:hypothetical protein